MEQPKKHRGRWSSASEYRRAPNGELIYTGTWMRFQGSCQQRKEAMGKTWLFSLAALSCAVAAGCVPAPGTGGCFYVIAPYVCVLGFSLSLVWAAARMSGEKGTQMKAYIYDATVAALPGRCVGCMIAAAVTLAGETVFLIRWGGNGRTAACIALYGLVAASAGFAMGLRRVTLGQTWQ